METMTISIGPLLAEHWQRVREIYEQGIATGIATFETDVPDWAGWDASHLARPRLVALQDGRTGARPGPGANVAAVVGWAALSPVSDRCVYGGVAEVSVYVAAECRGQGIGARLLGRLIEESERAGIWTLQAGMFPDNRASVAIHERHGFRRVGLRERLGKLQGEWKDVLMLERRSRVVGTD